jgi:hypothetical protein
MEHNFETYTSYYSLEDAKGTIEVLAQNNIEYKVEENFKSPLGEFYLGSDVSPKFVLKIKDSDFKKAEKVLSSFVSEDNTNNYLNDYPTEELKTILVEYDKWHPNDLAYAKELLTERGITYSESDLERIKNERITQLSIPKEASFYLIAGLFILAIIAGLFGVFLIVLPIGFGANYFYLKNNLPNGNKVYSYNEITRKRGLYLLYFSILTAVIWMFFYAGLYL